MKLLYSRDDESKYGKGWYWTKWGGVDGSDWGLSEPFATKADARTAKHTDAIRWCPGTDVPGKIEWLRPWIHSSDIEDKVSDCCSAELYEYHSDHIHARCKSCGEMAEVVERE